MSGKPLIRLRVSGLQRGARLPTVVIKLDNRSVMSAHVTTYETAGSRTTLSPRNTSTVPITLSHSSEWEGVSKFCLVLYIPLICFPNCFLIMKHKCFLIMFQSNISLSATFMYHTIRREFMFPPKSICCCRSFLAKGVVKRDTFISTHSELRYVSPGQ